MYEILSVIGTCSWINLGGAALDLEARGIELTRKLLNFSRRGIDFAPHVSDLEAKPDSEHEELTDTARRSLRRTL